MTKIFAHRGSRINRPENTLIAFEEALRVGADGIELDVQLSKDGEIVVIHDETVDRTTNGQGYVEDFTLAELKQLDAGSWFDEEYADQTIPTLEEVFELLAANEFTGCLNIEFKTTERRYKGIEKAVHNLIESENWGFDIVYSSFSLRSLYQLNRLDKTRELAYLVSKSSLLVWIGRLLPFITTLHLSKSWYFQHVQAQKKVLRLWTVNDEKQIKAAFQQGVAAIITDKPEIALSLREEQAFSN